MRNHCPVQFAPFDRLVTKRPNHRERKRVRSFLDFALLVVDKPYIFVIQGMIIDQQKPRNFKCT